MRITSNSNYLNLVIDFQNFSTKSFYQIITFYYVAKNKFKWLSTRHL